MLPLILGGLAAMRLLKRNPRRRRRNPHGLAAYASRVIQALVWTFSAAPKIPRAAMGMVREAFRRDIDAEAVAGWISAGKTSLPATIRGAFPKSKGELRAWATRNRVNPGGAMVRGTKRLASRLFNWHGGQGSGVYEVASNWHSGRPARIEAINDAWRELAQSLKRVTEMQGKGYTKRDLADITGLTRRLGLIAASHEGLGRNPKRRRRSGKVSVDAAAARLAHWRWHHNPTWDIQAGDRVTIRTPQGQKRTGRAVMRGPGGWVLNLGGRYGTPGIAAPENIVSVRRGKRRGPTRLDYRQFEADVPGTREA